MDHELKKRMLEIDLRSKKRDLIYIKVITMQIASLLFVYSFVFYFLDQAFTFIAWPVHVALVYLSLRYQKCQNKKIENN